MDLASKYRPKTFEDVVEQDTVVNILKNICSGEELTHRNFLFIGPAGTGKAQPLDSKVLTPDGFISMGDVEVGTEVFTSSGSIAKVSGVYPQGTRRIYRITLSDGTSIRVSDSHLNCVWIYDTGAKSRKDFVLSTTELIEFVKSSKFTVRVDIPSVDWEYKPVPIDPYLLGAMIGDGCLGQAFNFSNAEEDVIAKVDSLLRKNHNCTLKSVPSDKYSYRISAIEPRKHIAYLDGVDVGTRSNLVTRLVEAGYPKFAIDSMYKISNGTAKSILRKYPELKDRVHVEFNPLYDSAIKLKALFEELGLRKNSVDKHIPSEYLFNSKEVRLALLQGLFDTDGNITISAGRNNTESSHNEFSTSSSRLSDDFAFLVRSLGIRDHVVPRQSRYLKNGKHIDCSIAYRHFIKSTDNLKYFTSIKHTERWRSHQIDPIRCIKDIEYIGEEPCQCIYVDHPDHTYISEEGFIPTHNTTLARVVSNALNDGDSHVIEVDAASYSGVDSMRELIKQMNSYPLTGNYKTIVIDECHSLSSQSWQALLKPLEEPPARTVTCLCTTNPEKIPNTILSRVQTFQLSKISLEGIYSRLVAVIDQENQSGGNIQYDDAALMYIAKLAEGGMRDSLTLLSKVLSYSNNITMENVQTALNLPNYDDYFSLLNALVKVDNNSIVEIIDHVYNSGVNFVKWFEGMHSFICNIIKYICLEGDISRTMIPTTYEDKISGYSSSHLVICLRLSNTLLSLVKDLKSTQYLQETAITYLCKNKKGQ